MTVITAFHDWQSSPDPAKQSCAPNLTALRSFLTSRWNGVDLGCYADRPIRNGASPSSHASGAALDWRYQDPGCGRAVMLAEVLPLLIEQSAELGVQAIHDYAGARIWRPPAYRGGGDGWEPSTSPEMNPANLWLHIEVHPSAWSDARPVEQKLDGAPAPNPQPDDRELTTMDLTLQVLRRGDTGNPVRKAQKAYNHVTGEQLVVDGIFGATMGDAVRRVQAWFQASTRPETIVDAPGREVIAAQTWAILLEEPWKG